MGKGSVHPTTSDLFSITTNRADSALSADQVTPLPSPAAPGDDISRHVLPKDLPGSIRRLTDQDLDLLLAAVLVEQQRRGKKPPVNENAQKQRVEEASSRMSVGKLNAVRAAFKAGLRPSQIARQFGISQSDVRKALSSDGSRRAPSSD
jgi:DNA-directed RNA polymerase specialized sigma24 family protein